MRANVGVLAIFQRTSVLELHTDGTPLVAHFVISHPGPPTSACLSPVPLPLEFLPFDLLLPLECLPLPFSKVLLRTVGGTLVTFGRGWSRTLLWARM